MATVAGGAGDGDMNKRVAENYRRGVEAMEKKNWDLAIENFRVCVLIVSDNLVYRQLLRTTSRKKFNDNGTGAGMLAKTKLMGIRSRITAAKKKVSGTKSTRPQKKGC